MMMPIDGASEAYNAGVVIINQLDSEITNLTNRLEKINSLPWYKRWLKFGEKTRIMIAIRDTREELAMIIMASNRYI